jgi:peptidoglycan/xylan/chitin deacetylase (PgdA/CDA1 family)
VPTRFVGTPVGEQWHFAETHSIFPFHDDYENQRLALSWDEIRALDAGGHVIGSHTTHHERLVSDLTPDQLEVEIVRSKSELEEHLGHEIDVFCWVGGEEWSYSGSAAETIRRANYRLSFMTNNLPVRQGVNPLQIQRTNIEAWYPLDLVDFQLNGLLDVLYAAKRRRVNRLTA